MQVPSSGFPYWLFQGFTTQNGADLMNPAGTQTYYDKPEVVQALQFWMDLSQKHRIHPPGVVEWGTTPKDFFERKAAIIWTTTGNLTNIRSNAKFDFVWRCCRRQAARHAHARRQFHVFRRPRGRA